ncbi:TrmB family transcriptional regulator [Methanofollis tationis]|uniref:TrmB family transcriptional regulator n=1 Tax=Methanofollis tationis TaxID=81417 RepID=A0A7K4HQ87_9EURY|nr:TrmB family transcriptional regulator [Methanofollis tationis]NVO67434.1 TrmB family transcriptional regulator [Methanofollis tationis]
MHPSPESSGTIAEALKMLGLTKYEALVYVALLQVTRATATEIHELSGVPRASAYPVLDRLIQRNLVTVSHTTPKRFSAIPPEEAVNSLMRGISEKASYAKESLQELYDRRKTPEGGGQELVWTITGDANIISRIRDLIAQATDRVEVLGSWNLIGDLSEPLSLAAGRVRVDVITNKPGETVLPGIQISTIVPSIWSKEMGSNERAGIVFVDGSKVMVVMGSEGEIPIALYSESEGFYRFFSRYWSLIRGYGGARDQK